MVRTPLLPNPENEHRKVKGISKTLPGILPVLCSDISFTPYSANFRVLYFVIVSYIYKDERRNRNF